MNCVHQKIELRMYKIAITGDPDYRGKRKIQELIQKFKDSFGNTVTIYNGGTTVGVDKVVKKTAIDLGLKFKEYNPAYTGYRMYSAMDESYYEGKEYHPTQLLERYDRLMRNSDNIVIFLKKHYDRLPRDLDHLIKKSKKSGKKIVFIS